MRTIKFNCWHVIQRKMYSAETLYIDGMAIDPNGRNFVNASGVSVKLNQYSDDKMIPLQFTGMLDKNGREIYDGDILRCDDNNEDHEEFTTEVWFHEGKFLTREYAFPVSSWACNPNCWCEVIGNIYENLELLNGGQR